MKKIINISLCALVLMLGACNKKLDQSPVSNVVTTNFFSNTSDFLAGVNGVYSNLNAYPDYQLWMGEMRSDNVSASSDGNRDWQGINDFTKTLTTTAFIIGAYDNDFNGIYNANTVLNALKTKGGNISDASMKTRFEGEVRFLRALYYFDLVRFYGELPIIDSATTYQDALSIGRSPVKDVYNMILRDLDSAIAKLPATYTSTNIGRATSGAAKTLKGLVYLTRSGPTYSGVDGPTLASGEYDKALALFNDVISSGAYSFVANYPDIFSYTNENNKEVIFDVQYVSGYSTSSTTYGADYPSMLVPPGYFTGIGLSGYGNGYGTCQFNIPYDLTASYKAAGVTDSRDTFNILRQFKANTTDVVYDTTRPFIKKYINIAKIGANYRDWPINFIVMRYTDVLMMKAECILNGATGGSQTDVDAIVNQVRARAGLPAISNVTLAQLMEERRREFLGEGLRWNDLVREGMAVTTMNNWKTSQNLTNINTVINDYIIYPIPEAEILVKAGLYTQNPGY